MAATAVVAHPNALSGSHAKPQDASPDVASLRAGASPDVASLLALQSAQEQLAKLQDSLNCGVCYDLMVEPVVGNCGHDFCKRCVTRWAKQQNRGPRRSIKCPVCRRDFAAHGTSSLSVCIKLRDTIELLFPQQLAARAAEVQAEEEREKAEEEAEAAAEAAASAARRAARQAAAAGAAAVAAAYPGLEVSQRLAAALDGDGLSVSMHAQLQVLRAALGLPPPAGQPLAAAAQAAAARGASAAGQPNNQAPAAAAPAPSSGAFAFGFPQNPPAFAFHNAPPQGAAAAGGGGAVAAAAAADGRGLDAMSPFQFMPQQRYQPPAAVDPFAALPHAVDITNLQQQPQQPQQQPQQQQPQPPLTLGQFLAQEQMRAQRPQFVAPSITRGFFFSEQAAAAAAAGAAAGAAAAAAQAPPPPSPGGVAQVPSWVSSAASIFAGAAPPTTTVATGNTGAAAAAGGGGDDARGPAAGGGGVFPFGAGAAASPASPPAFTVGWYEAPTNVSPSRRRNIRFNDNNINQQRRVVQRRGGRRS